MLIECPECGRRAVSDEATRCPRCGIPNPGDIFWENRARPYEGAAQEIRNARKVWVKFVTRPCKCRRYAGEGNDVVGRAVDAKLVISSAPEFYRFESSDGSSYHAWRGSEPEYYIEFTVECEVCQSQWVGTLSYGKWSYDDTGSTSRMRLYIWDGPKRPKPNVAHFVYSIKLLVWGYEYSWSRKKTWVWSELILRFPQPTI